MLFILFCNENKDVIGDGDLLDLIVFRFVQYLTNLTGTLSTVAADMIPLALVVIVCILNILVNSLKMNLLSFITFFFSMKGVDVVGKFSVLFGILVLSPFIILAIWGSYKINYHVLIETPPNMSKK